MWNKAAKNDIISFLYFFRFYYLPSERYKCPVPIESKRDVFVHRRERVCLLRTAKQERRNDNRSAWNFRSLLCFLFFIYFFHSNALSPVRVPNDISMETEQPVDHSTERIKINNSPAQILEWHSNDTQRRRLMLLCRWILLAFLETLAACCLHTANVCRPSSSLAFVFFSSAFVGEIAHKHLHYPHLKTFNLLMYSGTKVKCAHISPLPSPSSFDETNKIVKCGIIWTM